MFAYAYAYAYKSQTCPTAATKLIAERTWQWEIRKPSCGRSASHVACKAHVRQLYRPVHNLVDDNGHIMRPFTPSGSKQIGFGTWRVASPH